MRNIGLGLLVLLAIFSGGSVAGSSGRSAAANGTLAPRPHIIKRLIPFGPKRKRQMAAYSERHYGEHTWRLQHPRVIVEHCAEAGTAESVYNTFAPDHPDPELHELPNVCAHFVVSLLGADFPAGPTDGSAAGTRSGSTGRRSGSSTPASAMPKCWATGARCTPRCR